MQRDPSTSLRFARDDGHVERPPRSSLKGAPGPLVILSEGEGSHDHLETLARPLVSLGVTTRIGEKMT
jgi:hypothetical protein